MAAITSAGSGNWSAGATWVGGVAPTSADTVTIASGHTVTLDAVGCACTSVTTAGTGTLTCTTSANWDFTLGNATNDANNILISTGTLNLDMSSAPTYTGMVYLNKGNVAAGIGIQSSGTCSITLKGANRKRWTRLNGAISAGATSAVVVNATGWRVGDRIIFGTTQAYNATPRIDEVILTSVSGNNIGWTGGITYDHADNGYVGNFSSNLTIRPFSSNRSYVALDNNGTRTAQDVAFNGLGGAVFAKYGLSLNNGNATVAIISNNAFYSNHSAQTNLVFLRFLAGLVTRQDNVFYCTVGNTFSGQATNLSLGDWERAIVFRSANTGLVPVNAGERFIDSAAMACANGAFAVGGFGNKFINCVGISSNQGVYSSSGAGTYLELDNCDLGAEFGASNATLFNLTGAARVVTRDCTVQSGGTFATGIPSSTKQSFVGVDLTNKNGDVTAQESYFPHCEIRRNNGNTNRSTSSVSIAPTIVSTDSQRSISIPCANGASIRIIGYVKKSHATNVSATVEITGLGSSVTPFTKANDTAWEQFDLTATNSSGNDANFTLTYTANSSSGTTNIVYFDGVPDAPFVTKARHYGFLFNESSPTVTVDPYVVLSESAAGALTGCTINGGTKHITFGAGTIDTASELYDYSRYWSVNNLTLDVPLSRAGSLFSLASGWTVVEPSISGITWGGGTIDWTSAGTKNGGFDSNVFDFQAAGTYEFGGATLSGTIDFINTSGGAVIVNVPAGTTYINTGPNITVGFPTMTRGVSMSFTGGSASRVVRLFDAGTQTVVATLTSPSYTWSEAASGSRTLDYTVLEDGYLPVRVTGLVVTGAVTGGVQSVQVQQTTSRAWQTPSGLTFGTNLFYSPSTKLAGLTAASTLQNLYSTLLSAFRTESSLQNKPFPMTENGPNSFSWIDGSMFDLTTYPNSISLLSRDGMRYVDGSGNVTDVWAALLSVGVPTGMQVRYQQQDGSGTTNAQATGNIDQLIKIKKTGAGAFDYTGYLVLKAQGAGYDQAEFDAVGTYGTLEDQLYVVGLTPTSNGIAAQAGITGITITDHGASPVTWNGKTYSITITDSGTHSGQEILQYVRDLNQFNYHDLVQASGGSYVTVRGKLYGDTGAVLKGVRVLRGANRHPDFTSHMSDDGTAYIPPVMAAALISGIVAGSRLQIYNVTTATEMVNAINATTSYSLGYPNGTGYSAGDVVRVRLTYCTGTTAKLPVEYVTIASAAGWSILANQQDDEVYIANGIDGSTVTEYSSDYVNVQIDVSDPDGVTSIQRGYAWYCDQMTGDDGIRYFYGAMVAEDAFNYLLNTDVADIKIQNTGTSGVTLTGGAVRRKDGSSPIAPGGSVYIYYGRTYGLETGTSGLTPTEADKLLSLPDAAGVWSHPTRTLTSGGGGTAPTAAEVATAVRAELATELGRVDTAVSSRQSTADADTKQAAMLSAVASAQGGMTPSQEAKLDGVKAKTDAMPSATQVADAVWTKALP